MKSFRTAVVVLLASVVAAGLVQTGAFDAAFLGVGDSNVTGQDPPIIILTIESTRGDRINCGKNTTGQMPHLCTIADDGILFTDAYSQGSFTHRALPPLLTGLPPNSIGEVGWQRRANKTQPTVFNRLKPYGYQQYIDLPSSFNLGRSLLGIQSNRTSLTAVPENSSFIYWNHLVKYAHAPYTPPSHHSIYDSIELTQDELWNYSGKRGLAALADTIGNDNLKTLYNSEVRIADNHISDMKDVLQRKEIYKDSLLIITADHGDLLSETDPDMYEDLPKPHYSHHPRPTPNTTHIPLVIKLPNNKHSGTVIDEPVRHIDIVPTIFDVLKLDASVPAPGESLLPLIDGSTDQLDLTVFAARHPESKWYIGEAMQQQLDPAKDCSQQASYSDASVASICRIFRIGEQHTYSTRPHNISDTQADRLRDLGYLQ